MRWMSIATVAGTLSIIIIHDANARGWSRLIWVSVVIPSEVIIVGFMVFALAKCIAAMQALRVADAHGLDV